MPILLQISDPHLLADPAALLKGVPTAVTLAAVLKMARERHPDCARVIWTGDLSHDLSIEACRLLREMLGDWLPRSLLIPGNHDDRAALRQVFPEVGGVADSPVGFVAEVGAWRLIGLDSQLPGEIPGGLSDAELSRLETCLASDRDRPTLLFLHHPPVPVGSRWLDEIRLLNPEPLERLIRSSPGVRGVFCGHVHLAFDGIFAGVPMYTAPSTAFQFQPGAQVATFDRSPPGLRVIGLEDERLRSEIVRTIAATARGRVHRPS
jgi:Icc protein